MKFQRRFLVVSLGLVLFASCTKKKAAPEEPAKPKEAPQDATHTGLNMNQQPTGEIRQVWQPTPGEQLMLGNLRQELEKFQSLKGDRKKAMTLFQANCAVCHGPEGKGGGPGGEQLAVAPTNFHEWPIKYGRKLEEIAFTIQQGRSEGTMPSFAQLKREEIFALVYLIDSFYQARPKDLP